MIVGFSLGVLKYVSVRDVVDVGFSVVLYCDAWSCRCACMGSMSVSKMLPLLYITEYVACKLIII